MTYILRILTIWAIFGVHRAEWIEITQQPKNSTTNQTQTKTNTIRILKKNEAELLYQSDNTTPSPHWVEYQRERFGQRQNSNSQKLVVSTENRLKNSVKIIVPANTKPQSQIIQTRTRMDVINDKSNEEIIELPQLSSQTATTKRDMSNAQIIVGAAPSSENDDHDNNQANNEDFEIPIEDDGSDTVNGIQMPSWKGFLKFLKTIKANWLKHSGFSFEDKIQLLKNLRDNLMQKIEEQFSLIWTPKERLRRRRRGLLDESTIHFPPEISLMSINFLTFAVFLIKLALQIVHIIKSKHYNFTAQGITTQLFGKTTLKT